MYDTVVYSPDKNSHLEHVREVIKILSEHKLTLNIKKAKLFCKEIRFLVHIIKNNTVIIDPERTVNIKNFSTPKNLRFPTQDLSKLFTGICSYWNKHVPKYAEICFPLHALKKKDITLYWSLIINKLSTFWRKQI